MTEQTKIEALREWLAATDYPETEIDDIEVSDYDAEPFEVHGNEYLVLTDSEADDRCLEYIKESVWAFNANFLSSFTGLPEAVFVAMQDKCEGANETFLELIEECGEGIEAFADESTSADGRGHFMNTYDGEEHEHGEFFIYRTN